MAWASALELDSPLPPGCPSPKSCQVSFLDPQDTFALAFSSGHTLTIPKTYQRQPPDLGVDPVACHLPFIHQGNHAPANPVLRGWDGWPGFLGKDLASLGVSWGRKSFPKGLCLLPSSVACPGPRHGGRPRGCGCWPGSGNS